MNPAGTKRTRWTIRITLITICMLLIGMMAYHHYYINANADDTIGIIFLFIYAILFIFSEVYDYLAFNPSYTPENKNDKKNTDKKSLG